jgi:hypothetical protein
MGKDMQDSGIGMERCAVSERREKKSYKKEGA